MILPGVWGCHDGGARVAMWTQERIPSGGDWPVDSDRPTPPTDGVHRIRRTGAVLQTVSARFYVRAGDAGIKDPALRMTPPVSSSSARVDPSAVDILRMHRVPVGHFPGWHVRFIPPRQRDREPLDVLVPLSAPRGGMPAVMLPGETYAFWLDLTIPKFTAAGVYTSDIELTSGGKTVGALSLELTVLPIALPDEPGIPVIAEVDHRALVRAPAKDQGNVTDVAEPRGGAAAPTGLGDSLSSTLRMLQRHGLTPVLSELMPSVKMDTRGGLTVDWSSYDAVAQPCLDGTAFDNRQPVPLWPMPWHEVFASWDRGVGLSSPSRARLLRPYLSACAEHFESKGWLHRGYALPPFDAHMAAETAAGARMLVDLARGANEHIAVASRLWPQDMAPYGWMNYPAVNLAEAVDIWVPPAQFYDPAVMAAERAAGRRTWMAVDRPPFSGSTAVYAREVDVRVLTWQAASMGAQAVYLGCVNRWPGHPPQPTPEDCVRADPNVLIYPGGPFGLDEPVASVRLKYLRDGIQEAAFRAVLMRTGLEHVATTLTRSIAPHGGTEMYRTHFADGRSPDWINDPALFDIARDIMADALLAGWSDQPLETRAEEFARNVMWRRFMVAARSVGLRVDGTRLRVSGSRTGWEAQVDCAVTIDNGTRVPVGGTLRFSGLPDGWDAPDDAAAVAAIAPNGSRRVTLSADAGTLLMGPGGTLSLPIEFNESDGDAHRCDARVSCIAAVPRNGSIRIDGDLSDWPPGAANVASDFRLISDRPVAASEDIDRPSHATSGFVMRDADYLYVAVNSEADDEAVRTASRRNDVVYEDMIPVGEELVEVLIDPLNAGTRSPSDLYHIAVKPSGTYLIEKGIMLDPPCGRRTPWSADVSVATGRLPGRWVVELRIPLAAFGQGAVQHAMWGFNLTRSDGPRQEFSTWSGAVGNAYDPLSLGNLYLP